MHQIYCGQVRLVEIKAQAFTASILIANAIFIFQVERVEMGLQIHQAQLTQVIKEAKQMGMLQKYRAMDKPYLRPPILDLTSMIK